MRILPVSTSSVLIELADLMQARRLQEVLLADAMARISDIVPGARTLLVRAAPGHRVDGNMIDRIRACAKIAGQDPTSDGATGAEEVELPVGYDGPDIDDVARYMGLSTDEVIEAHQQALWTVAFCGFAPGFAYMAPDDLRFDIPRKATPRQSVPAGAVGLAGKFGGIYPKTGPGGWQLIGHCEEAMWDTSRSPAALLLPGVKARFVRRNARVYPAMPVAAEPDAEPSIGLEILSTQFPIVVQDFGREGHLSQGVGLSGALDRDALGRANRAVGNASDVAGLEITLGNCRFRVHVPMTLALSGAAEGAVILRRGLDIPVEMGMPFAADAGDEIAIPPAPRGKCAYLAVRGGFDIEPVLGSRATDLLSGIGPAPLREGAMLGLAHAPAHSTVADPEIEPYLPASDELVELPVVLGPRTDWFSDDEVTSFLSQEWLVTPESSRVGLRLASDRPLSRKINEELPSEGTECGAIQIAASGMPILFLADHPVTGGYPIIATVEQRAIGRAGQMPPGARVRFTAAAPFDALEFPDDAIDQAVSE